MDALPITVAKSATRRQSLLTICNVSSYNAIRYMMLRVTLPKRIGEFMAQGIASEANESRPPLQTVDRALSVLLSYDQHRTVWSVQDLAHGSSSINQRLNDCSPHLPGAGSSTPTM